jgi:tetratricopeptide (TPR) repeat protein
LATAYSDRGVAYGRKGEQEKAVADFSAAIRLDPKNAIAYSNRGVAFAREGEQDKAIADFSAAVQLDTKYAERPRPPAERLTAGGAWRFKHDKAIRRDELYFARPEMRRFRLRHRNPKRKRGNISAP